MFQMLSNIARCFTSSSVLSISSSQPPKSFDGYRRSFGNSKTTTLGMIVATALLHLLFHTSLRLLQHLCFQRACSERATTPLPTQPNQADQPTCSLGYLPAPVSPNYHIYTSLIDPLVNEIPLGTATAHKKSASEAAAAQMLRAIDLHPKTSTKMADMKAQMLHNCPDAMCHGPHVDFL